MIEQDDSSVDCSNTQVDAQVDQQLVNDFPGKDIYCKLSFPKNLSVGEVVVNLFGLFPAMDGIYVPLEDNVHTFQYEVMKFQSADGPITLTYHPDGTWIYKHKASKQRVQEKIQQRNEIKLVIPPEENIYDFTNNQISQPLTPENYLGSYLRIKNQFYVKKTDTGNVYKINGDTVIAIEGVSPDIEDVFETCDHESDSELHQIEIKYRGRLNQPIQTESTVDDVARDIISLQQFVMETVGQQGIVVNPTDESKNQWIQKIRGADPVGGN